ncbi:MAG: bifunctional tRNA (5-methylaminomethyl-2-thiouridine)(34)-methyltransferase MnmD/FAD-dependent 5-carboxymethylaminomethyl-2-thiouridine(34) oxidoreductase MnmC [Paraglaciecola sp.]
MTIKTADIQFNADGTPVATDFDDVYFSSSDGAQETQYVFLQNNQLPSRWQHWSKPTFVIAETGFGTGLNLLVTLAAFKDYLAQNPASTFTLHFISTEKYPLNHADLVQALGAFVQFKDSANALIAQYPVPLNGCHRMAFLNNRVIVDLWLGDIHDSLPQWHTNENGLVDAWYLDGFAPSKNPQMWSAQLFEQMARLAAKDCTFATFTAAGFVKRGLRDAGFIVEKRKGHGRKREMLAGYIAPEFQAQINRQQARYYQRSAYAHVENMDATGANAADTNNRTQGAATEKPKVAIIGAGIAGATIAYAMAQKGYECDVYFKEAEPAQGASGNPQAGFYPQLNVDASNASQINAHSFVYAANQYRQLLSQGFDFAHQWCGVLQLGFKPALAQRYAKLTDNQLWPPALVRYVEANEASRIANCEIPYGGLFMPLGGWIDPLQLVNALFNAAACLSKVTLHSHHCLSGLEQKAEHTETSQPQPWQLCFNQTADKISQIRVSTDIVIFATGAQSLDIQHLTEYPLRMVRGQVEAVPTQPALSELNTVLCHKGYLTPEYNGHHALGSTYVKDDLSTEYRQSEQDKNLATHYQSLAQCRWAQDVVGNAQGRAAVRCSSPDHLPLVGALADISKQKTELNDLYKALPLNYYPKGSDVENLYLLTGLGSRGLTTAPLMAELLASQISGQPLPMVNNLLNTLNPNRFLIRQLIRREI